MAVFRIEKTQNYTVMSNHHLRNTALSLKAKGLLSLILSLPENWDYTLKGLSHINRESIDAIRAAIQELERTGYVTRSRERKENGQLGGTEYVIREQPDEGFSPGNGAIPPISVSPTLDEPMLDFPTQANPTLEVPTKLNKEKASKEKSTDLSSTHSIPIPSRRVYVESLEGKGVEAASMNYFELYREIIWENIEYPYLLERHKYDHERIDEIVGLMLETVCTSRKTVRIASDDYPAAIVKSKFLKLDSEHTEFVLDCMKNNTTEIRNIKKYLLAVLFNAPTTISSYYTGLVAHDMASDKLSVVEGK